MNQHTTSSNAEHTLSNLPYKHCLNCGSELQGMYCHVCGQQATSKTPTIPEFIIEYINNAFIWDPRFFKTTWNLIRRPGYLTNEFLSGKFASQEHPLKLNMFLLFVFITLFVFFSGTEQMNNSLHSLTNDEKVRTSVQLDAFIGSEIAGKMKESPRDTVQLLAPLVLAEKYPEIMSKLETIESTEDGNLDKWTAAIPHVLIEEKIVVPDENGYYRFNQKSEYGADGMQLLDSIWAEMVRLITQYFPMLALFTAPILSMSLGFVQRKKRLPRIHHFIFALHYTAFLEFLMLCIYLLYLIGAPSMELLEQIMLIGSCLYLTIAFRKVYATRNWLRAILNALFISLVYFIIGLFVVIGIFFVSCFIIAIQMA